LRGETARRNVRRVSVRRYVERVLVSLCPSKLGRKEAATCLQHMKYVLTHKMRATRITLNALDDLL